MSKCLTDFHDYWIALVVKGMANYSSLNQAERIWYNTQSLIGDVDNGGLISHYCNYGADRNKDTITDLQILGFSDLADLLKTMNKLFPGGEPSSKIEERNEAIQNWPEGKFNALLDELDNQFYKRENVLEQELIKHIELNVIPK